VQKRAGSAVPCRRDGERTSRSVLAASPTLGNAEQIERVVGQQLADDLLDGQAVSPWTMT
jgi:hypothetical protein